MKRFASVVLTLIIMVSSVSASAAALRTMTTERLLSGFLDSLAGLVDSPEVTLDYEQDGDSVRGGLIWDEAGLPVLSGVMTSDGEIRGADISAEGVVLYTPEGMQGARWETIMDTLLGEIGLEGLFDISLEDVQVFSDISEAVIGGISDGAVSVQYSETTLGGQTAGKCLISVDAAALAKDLDAAVPAALEKNRLNLDKFIKNGNRILKQVFPGMPDDFDTSALLEMWSTFGLSSAPLEGIGLRIECVYTGGAADAWELSAEAAGITLSAQNDGDGFRFSLNPGDGSVYNFDSADVQYILDMFAGLPGYITAEAFSYSDEIEDGERRIALNVDDVCLRKQLMTGAMQIIAANRDGVNDILNRYRPWLAALYPYAASATADTLLMGLSVLNMGSRYYPLLQGFTGIVFGQGGLRFSMSYPVEEIACGAVPAGGEGKLIESATAEPEAHYIEFAAAKTGPVRVGLELGEWSFNLYADENSLEIKSLNPYGWDRRFRGYVDGDGESMTCTYTQNYYMHANYTDSVTMTAESGNIHIYTGDGSVDINVMPDEDGALINALIDDDVITGTLDWTDNTAKLFLTDGKDIFEAMLRADENSVSLSANTYGFTFSAAARWSENSIAAEVNTPEYTFEAAVETCSDGFEVSWKRADMNAASMQDVTIALKDSGFLLRKGSERMKMYTSEELTVEACWEEGKHALDIRSAYGYGGRMQDAFSLTYRTGQLMLSYDGKVVHISDITPEGSAHKNITRICVYNALDYIMHNSASLERFVKCVDVTTKVSDGCYSMTVSEGNAVLAELNIDFDPDTAAPVYDEDEVLWLTPELIRLMYFKEIEGSENGEAPISVYAPEASALIPESSLIRPTS